MESESISQYVHFNKHKVLFILTTLLSIILLILDSIY